MKNIAATLIFLSFICSPLVKAQTKEVVQLTLNYQKLQQLESILENMYKGYEILTKGYNTIPSRTFQKATSTCTRCSLMDCLRLTQRSRTTTGSHRSSSIKRCWSKNIKLPGITLKMKINLPLMNFGILKRYMPTCLTKV